MFRIVNIFWKIKFYSLIQADKQLQIVTKNSIIKSFLVNLLTTNQPNPKLQTPLTPCEKDISSIQQLMLVIYFFIVIFV